MRGSEHYRRAEQALAKSFDAKTPESTRMWLTNAAVHAQLAHTAALVGLDDAQEDRGGWREVLGHPLGTPALAVDSLLGEQDAGAGLGLIPLDICGSWIDGRRCILRPGHDEPCLPYRLPAVMLPACARCGRSAASHGISKGACEAWRSSAGWAMDAPEGADPGHLEDAAAPADAAAAPAGPASQADGDLGPALP